MYYNTTSQTGETLKKYRKSNNSQTSIVLEHFKQHPCEVLSPSEVWDQLMRGVKISKNTPLTSVRRSITDLTSDGKLIRSEMTKIGIYGKPEHQWFLNCPVGQVSLL